MENKSIAEEMGITYHLKGDVLIPDLTIGEEIDETPLGKYGQMREDYLQEHRRIQYSILQVKMELWEHLQDVDKRATEMEEQLTAQMAKQEGVNEALKKADQMEWVRRMNNIQARVQEIVLNEIVYA